MVQFYGTSKPRSAYITEALAPAAGQTAGNLLGNYLASQSLQNVVSNPKFQNAPLSEKYQSLESALRPFGQRGRGILEQYLNMEQLRNQEREQSILGRLTSGQEVSPQEMGSLSPQTQLKYMAAQQHLNSQKDKAAQEKIAAESFSKGYQALQEDNLEGFNAVINDPKTPYSIKHQLTNLKNQQDVRTDVSKRELRARQTLLINAYNKEINSESNRLKTARLKDRPAIEARIQKLKKLLQRDMKRLVKDPDSYGTLAIWDTDAGKYFAEESEESEQGIEGEVEQSEGPKIQFDPSNKEHRARAEQLYKQYKDKEKVREILSKEYEGL